MSSTGEILEDLPTRASEALTEEAFLAPELCGRFLDRVEEVWLRSPRAAMRPAEIGLQLAAGLSARSASRPHRDRLKARALGVLGGVRRSLGQNDEAEAAYHLAAEILLTLGEPLGLADLARRLATLRRDQQRFAEARRFAAWAIDCYGQEGDERGRARAQVELGIVLGCEQSDPEGTVRCFRQALEHLDSDHDATYYRCAVHNLASALCLGGDDRGLDDWLERSLARGGFEPGSPGAFKACWLEGLAAVRRGDAVRAEAAFEEARFGFLRLGLAAEAATVAMDLARLYLENGRGADARRLAGELFPVFQALRSQREVTAALNLYVNAAMLDRLSLDLVQRVRGGIAALGWWPSLPG